MHFMYIQFSWSDLIAIQVTIDRNASKITAAIAAACFCGSRTLIKMYVSCKRQKWGNALSLCVAFLSDLRLFTVYSNTNSNNIREQQQATRTAAWHATAVLIKKQSCFRLKCPSVCTCEGRCLFRFEVYFRLTSFISSSWMQTHSSILPQLKVYAERKRRLAAAVIVKTGSEREKTLETLATSGSVKAVWTVLCEGLADGRGLRAWISRAEIKLSSHHSSLSFFLASEGDERRMSCQCVADEPVVPPCFSLSFQSLHSIPSEDLWFLFRLFSFKCLPLSGFVRRMLLLHRTTVALILESLLSFPIFCHFCSLFQWVILQLNDCQLWARNQIETKKIEYLSVSQSGGRMLWRECNQWWNWIEIQWYMRIRILLFQAWN